MIRAVYIHATNGRIRIHVAATKGSQSRAWEVERKLGCLPGLTEVKANPLTGNVLIRYDSRLTSESRILGELQIMGYPGGEPYIPFNTVRAGSDSGWSTELVKFGIETLLTALIL
jgi:copper chaperone CopZ